MTGATKQDEIPKAKPLTKAQREKAAKEAAAAAFAWTPEEHCPELLAFIENVVENDGLAYHGELPIADGYSGELGLIADVPNRIYHGGAGVSKSGLDKIRSSPLDFAASRILPRTSSKAMDLGTCIHAALLEPDVLPSLYVEWKREHKRGGAWEDFKAEHEGKIILTTEEVFTLRSVERIVRLHPTAGPLLDPEFGPVEISCYWIDEEFDVLCKCRPDKLNTTFRLVVDVKRTKDARISEFMKSVHNFRYHVQAAWYLDGLRAAGVDVRSSPKSEGFVFVCVETDPPFKVRVVVLSHDDVQLGRTLYRHDLHVYARCLNDRVWPGLDPDITVGELPGYARRVNIS